MLFGSGLFLQSDFNSVLFSKPSKDIPLGAFSEIAAVGLKSRTATMRLASKRMGLRMSRSLQGVMLVQVHCCFTVPGSLIHGMKSLQNQVFTVHFQGTIVSSNDVLQTVAYRLSCSEYSSNAQLCLQSQCLQNNNYISGGVSFIWQTLIFICMEKRDSGLDYSLSLSNVSLSYFYYSSAVINMPDKVLEPLKIEVSLHGLHSARISLRCDLICPLSPD